MGRFINADAFASTGQGILGNNMFAYCNNNPVNMVDYSGTMTVTVGVSGSGTAFIGSSGGLAVTFDEDGIEIQYSYSEPSERSTTTIGLLSAGAAVTVQITNKNSASELRGNSTYLGGSVGETGFDVVIDRPVADPNGELIGVQISHAIIGAGLDLHVSQTYTSTIKTYSWEDIWQGTKDLFSLFVR